MQIALIFLVGGLFYLVIYLDAESGNYERQSKMSDEIIKKLEEKIKLMDEYIDKLELKKDN